MTNYYVRRLTKKWLKNQDCTVVAYWGDEPCDLWEVLDVYAHSIMDKESTEDALCNSFPEIFEDIDVKVINHEGYSLSSALKQFSDCRHKMILLKDEEVELNQ